MDSFGDRLVSPFAHMPHPLICQSNAKAGPIVRREFFLHRMARLLDGLACHSDGKQFISSADIDFVISLLVLVVHDGSVILFF